MALDGVSRPVPLRLYPPGCDLSRFVVFNPASGEVLRISRRAASPMKAGPVLESGSGGDGDGGVANVSCGFYRVAGVTITGGVTNNSTLSDLLTLTAKPETGVKYLGLLVDGWRFPASAAQLPPFTNPVTFQDVDTSRMTNGGPYTLQVEAVYEVDTADGGGMHHTLSHPFTVSITNAFSFPQWDDLTEDEVCNFDIVCPQSNVEWELDICNIYDYLAWLYGYTDYLYPIHVATGTATNGIIRYDWNLVDDYGNARNIVEDDPYFVSFTYTSADGWASYSAIKNPLKRQPAKWPEQGHWVVAWQDMFSHYYDANNYLRTSFTNLLMMANLPESDVSAAPPFWQPPIGGTNAQTFPIRNFYNSFRTDLNPTNIEFFQSTANDESLLTAMLSDSRARNLFYYGHGASEWIAGSVYAPLLRDYGMHRYRFVWLDGCQTGNGSWPDTFGIPGPGIFSIDYYQERTKRPGLFVGNKYSTPIGVPRGEDYEVGGVKYDGEIPRSVPEFYNQFIFFWQIMGREFKTAVRDAQDLVKSAYPNPKMSYLNGPKKNQPYWPGDDQVRVGYEEMQFNRYNKYYDIPRP